MNPSWRRLIPGICWLSLFCAAFVFIGVMVDRIVPPSRLIPPPLQPPALHLRHFHDLSCQSAYERLFARDQLDVRVVFGYKDARPARFVGDRYEKMVFAQALVKSCSAGQGACGFLASREDSELYQKTLEGPDGRPRQVLLRLLHSSAGPDDVENRRNPHQAWLSRRARQVFLEGLKKADIVFYDGHSRDGGGPDFDPPRTRRDSHTDYGWYRRNQPGLKEMIAALSQTTGADEGPRLLGMFSCASTKHFSKLLSETRPGLAVVASRKLIYFADALESSLETLSAILEMKCQPDFDRSIRTGSNQAGAFLSGFFE